MKHEPRHKTEKTNREAGFSLIELMISVVIFIIFVSAVYGLMRIANVQKDTASDHTEVIKNARLSLNMIGRDAVNAGFGYSRVGGYAPDNLTNLRMGLPADTDTQQDLITAIASGDQINTNTFLPATGRTDVVSFAFRDITFNSGDPITLTNAADLGGNGVAVTTAAGEAAAASPYDLYLVSDGARTALGLVTAVPNTNTLHFQTGAADPLGVNAPYTGTADVRSRLRACGSPTENGCFDYTNIISAKRVTWVSYHVENDGTLVRTLYGNNTGQPAASQIQQQPIAYNVRDLQIRYLLRDGTVTTDPSAANTNQPNLNNVVQINVNVSTTVTTIINGRPQEKIINLNSTFSTKNLNYDIS